MDELNIAVVPHDSFRKGLPTAVQDVSLARHPIEELQRNREERLREWRTREVSCQFGIAAAMKHNADEEILSKFHRFPGLVSSRLGLEIQRGRLNKLEFDDWLGDQDMHPKHFANFHATMEHSLKM